MRRPTSESRQLLLCFAPVAFALLACTCGESETSSHEGPPPFAQGPPKTPLAKASWDARPRWDERFLGYAPSRDDAEAIFKAAANPSSNVVSDPERGLFACRVEVSKDTNAGESTPDLMVTVDLASQAWLRREFAPSRIVHFTFPLAELNKDDLFRIDLVDDDYMFDDDLGALSATYKGVTPITSQEDELAFECRYVERKAVEELSAATAAKADEALTGVDKLQHDLVTLDLGAMRLPRREPHAPLYQLAALMGWAAPEVTSRVKRAADADARLVAEGKKVLDATLAASDRPAFRLGELTFTKAKWTCTPPRDDAGSPTCTLALTGSVDGKRPVRFERLGNKDKASEAMLGRVSVYGMMPGHDFETLYVQKAYGGTWTPSKKHSGFFDVAFAPGEEVRITLGYSRGPYDKPLAIAAVLAPKRGDEQLLMLPVD